jgi:excisionase family DNA binding protein
LIIGWLVLHRQGDPGTGSAADPHRMTQPVRFRALAGLTGFGLGKGDAVAAQRKGNAGVEPPSYLLPAEVAELLSVSPKTVSRWAKEGKLPFMSTLGGHRRYPEAEIRKLVDELRQEPTT